MKVAGQRHHRQAQDADLVEVRQERLPPRQPAEHPAEDPQREPRHSAQARDPIDQSAAKVGDPVADGIQRTAGTRLCHSLTPHQNQRLERLVARASRAPSSYGGRATGPMHGPEPRLSPALLGELLAPGYLFLYFVAPTSRFEPTLPVEASRQTAQGRFTSVALWTLFRRTIVRPSGP